MQKNNKIISWILILFVFVSSLGKADALVFAQETEEKKQYVIVMEEQSAYDKVCEEVKENVSMETPVLSENNIIVAELTELEANEIRDDAIVVEEDFMLKASTAETEEDAGEELTKDEIYRIKKECHDQRMKAKNAESNQEYEWNLQAINLDDSTVEEQAKEKVKVAVLDSGVDCVSGINVVGDVNLVEEESDLPDMFQDMTGHGTGIAAIISGNGETGIYGINPKAAVYSVRVLDKENKAPLSRIIRGIYWCIENDMDIINMSFGTPVYSAALEQAVKDAYQANILMIGAAGNNGEAVEYPAAFDEVMAVAATDANSKISDFCNTGEELDVAAPGEKIRTAGFFDGSVITHGTSIAVPHVTGVASLLWEKDLTKSNEFIRQLIDFSTKEISGEDDCGLLDADYALTIYDDFEKQFDEDDLEIKGNLPQNVEKPENFEYVNDDENYVEGRWGEPIHQGMVGNGFSTDEMDIIKNGVVFPDTAWPGKGKNSPWHGRWRYLTNAKGSKYRLGENINYAAVVEVITSIALKGGDTSTFANYAKYKGMDNQLFGDIKGFINGLSSNVNYQQYTKKQRKLFIYGCGIHALTDIFAHSTTDENGNRITHEDKTADDIEFRPRRYKAASYAASNAIDSLNAGIATDGCDILMALEDTYTKATKYHLINVKKYVVGNGYGGYNDAILNLANIDF